MNINKLKIFVVAVLLCMSFFGASAQAATGVGKAIISIGKVFTTGKDGKEKKLKRRGKVFEGDTIKVGKKSRLQLRFIDNQLIVLKENTVFRIDEYKFKDKKDKNKSAVLSLLKGGMRSVTGLIGKSARDKYKVRTPVATMGVRGTHYILQICDGNCGGDIQGIVGTVLEGSIEMINDGGSAVFGTDQFFNVPSPSSVPVTITNPPTVLISSVVISTEGTEGTGDVDAGTSPPDGSLSLPEGITETTEVVSFVGGEQTTVVTTIGAITVTSGGLTSGIPSIPAPIGSVAAYAGNALDFNGQPAPIGVTIQSGVFGNNVFVDTATGRLPVAANFLDSDPSSTTFGQPVSFLVFQGATISNPGSTVLGGVNVNWGRWNQSSVLVVDGGVPQSLMSDLAFIYADNSTSQAQLFVLEQTSVYNSYTLIGGPVIRDESGGIVTGSVSFDVDFTSASLLGFSGNLTGVDGRTYNISQVNSTESLFDIQSMGLPLSGTCSGAGACSTTVTLTGRANGVLIGPNADGFVGSFGASNPSAGVGIFGSGVFEAMPGGQ